MCAAAANTRTREATRLLAIAASTREALAVCLHPKPLALPRRDAPSRGSFDLFEHAATVNVRTQEATEALCTLGAPCGLRSLPQSSVSRGSFDLFEYARHFLHCCSRLLGLEHRSVRGLIGVDFNGRRVNVRCGARVLLRACCCACARARACARACVCAPSSASAFKGRRAVAGCACGLSAGPAGNPPASSALFERCCGWVAR